MRMKPGIDRAVGRTWVVALVMAVGLMANITYVQGFEAQDLRDDSLNARRLQDRFKVDRGPITADGERLAWSEKTGDDRYQRRYKDGKVFAPITGYFSVFSQTGIEDAENHFLDGTDPRLATTNLVDKLIGKHVPGGTVEATVDPEAQRVAYRALASSGARRGAAVVLDAETGAVLVLASTPSYDPGDVSMLDGEKRRRRSSGSTARSSSRCSTRPRGSCSRPAPRSRPSSRRRRWRPVRARTRGSGRGAPTSRRGEGSRSATTRATSAAPATSAGSR